SGSSATTSSAAANSPRSPVSIPRASPPSKGWALHERAAQVRALGRPHARVPLAARAADPAAVGNRRVALARHALALLVRLRDARVAAVPVVLGIRRFGQRAFFHLHARTTRSARLPAHGAPARAGIPRRPQPAPRLRFRSLWLALVLAAVCAGAVWALVVYAAR